MFCATLLTFETWNNDQPLIAALIACPSHSLHVAFGTIDPTQFAWGFRTPMRPRLRSHHIGGLRMQDRPEAQSTAPLPT